MSFSPSNDSKSVTRATNDNLVGHSRSPTPVNSSDSPHSNELVLYSSPRSMSRPNGGGNNTGNDTYNTINNTNYNVNVDHSSNAPLRPFNDPPTLNHPAAAISAQPGPHPNMISASESKESLWRDHEDWSASLNRQRGQRKDDFSFGTSESVGRTSVNVNSSTATAPFSERPRPPNSSSTSTDNNNSNNPAPTYTINNYYYYCLPPNAISQFPVSPFGNAPNQGFGQNNPGFVPSPLVSHPNAIFQNDVLSHPAPSPPNHPPVPNINPRNPVVLGRDRVDRVRSEPKMQDMQISSNNPTTTTSATAADNVIPQTPGRSGSPLRFPSPMEDAQNREEVPGLYKPMETSDGKTQWACTYLLKSTPGDTKFECGHITHHARDRTRHVNKHAREEEKLMEAGKLQLKDAVAYPHRVEAVFECRVPDCEYLKMKGERYRAVGYRVDGAKSKHNAIYHPELVKARRLMRMRRALAMNKAAGEIKDDEEEDEDEIVLRE